MSSDASSDSGVFVEKKEVPAMPDATPVKSAASPPMSPDASAAADATSATSLAGDVQRIALWTNPVESGLVVAATLLVFYLLFVGGYTVVTLAAYAGLSQLAASLTFRLVYPLLLKFGVLKGDASADDVVEKRVAAFSGEVKKILAGVYDSLVLAVNAWTDLLTTKDYKQLVKPALSLAAISLAGKILSTQTIVFLGLLTAFSVPALYTRNKELVDAKAGIVLKQVDEYSVIAQERFRAASEQGMQKAKELAGTLREKVSEFKGKMMTPKKAAKAAEAKSD